jgi:hypothetical protein
MHLRISLLFPTTVFLLIAPFGAAAQEESTPVNDQLWIDYNPRWTDQSSREIFGDLGLRTGLGSNDWVRLVARPGVRAPVGPFRLAGGLGTFYRINNEGADRMEIRPFQGIAATWPKRRRLRIQHYLRLEERLMWETADWTKDASLRGRFRLQTDYSFSGFSSRAGWRVVFHIEGFYTIAGNDGQTEEQIRVGAGIGRNLGSKLRLRADFTWEKVGFDAFGPTNQFYIRLRVFQGWLRHLTTQDG